MGRPRCVAVQPCSNETLEEEGRFSIVLDGQIHTARKEKPPIVLARAGSSCGITKY